MKLLRYQKRKKKPQQLRKLFLVDGIALNVDAPDTTAHLFVNQAGVFSRNYSASASEFISVICSECGFTELYKADKFNS